MAAIFVAASTGAAIAAATIVASNLVLAGPLTAAQSRVPFYASVSSLVAEYSWKSLMNEITDSLAVYPEK